MAILQDTASRAANEKELRRLATVHLRRARVLGGPHGSCPEELKPIFELTHGLLDSAPRLRHSPANFFADHKTLYRTKLGFILTFIARGITKPDSHLLEQIRRKLLREV